LPQLTFQTVLRILRYLALTLMLVSVGRVAAQDRGPLDLDATGAALTAIETTLKQLNLADAELQRLRAENDPLGIALQAAIANMTPRLAASTKRLAELTPKTDKDKPATPVNDAAAADLASEQQKHDALDARLRAARALLFRVDDNATRISARRRAVFARETFAHSTSVFDPQLWRNVSRETPADVAAVGAIVGAWASDIGGRVTAVGALSVAGAVLALALIAVALQRIGRRFLDHDSAAEPPTRLRRALAAAWTLLVLAVVPLVGLSALAAALDLANLSDRRMQGALEAVLDAARLLIVVNAVGRAMLSPHAEAWRLIPVGDRAARRIVRAAMTIAAIWSAERLIEPAADAAASLNIVVAGRAVGAALAVVAVAYTLRRLSPAPQTAAAGPDRWAPVRAVGWAAAFVVFGATATGYVAFATFLVNQAIFLAILGCCLYLIDIVVQDGTAALLRPEAEVGGPLKALLGLSRGVLAQIAVLVQGVARVALVVIAAAAVLEPWGVQSQDWFSSLRSAYFGFAVGGVTLSLSSMLAAVVVFGVAQFATRLIRNWLSDRLLPETRFDPGVSNSISTIFGYVGGAVAVLLGAAQIGLDVQKLAIVAGALSVGIGFGLQSIANNFVSGLILLWERSIRVGDLVVVGADQGFVRKINARATEIETFDRATLIVPNSNFVTTVVKNWVHTDRIGRIIVAINVAYESDAEAVRAILIDAARAHGLVLSIPAPTVLLSEFADWALKFNLVCFVDEVETAPRTQSDISFDILRRLREARIRIPYPAPHPEQTW
jgi:small-conductance mechanosensitive channel